MSFWQEFGKPNCAFVKNVKASDAVDNLLHGRPIGEITIGDPKISRQGGR
jgi:hypothetical protein